MCPILFFSSGVIPVSLKSPVIWTMPEQVTAKGRSVWRAISLKYVYTYIYLWCKADLIACKQWG